MEMLLEDAQYSKTLIAFLKREDIQDLFAQNNLKEIFRRWNLTRPYDEDELQSLFDAIGVVLPEKYEFYKGICVNDWKNIVEYFKTLFPGVQLNTEKIFRGANLENRKLRAAVLGATPEHTTELIDILDNFHDWLDKNYPYYGSDSTYHGLSLGGTTVNGMAYTDFIDVVVTIEAV